MPLDVVILGQPGAGKGTQAKLVSEDAGIPHVNTGDMLRAERDAGSELGRRVEAIIGRGDLVPDELVVDMIRERLAREDTAAGFVLDGFPRTLPQADALDRLLEELGRALSVVLHFQLPAELAEERLLSRALEEGRPDDTPDVIRHRMDVQRVPDELIARYRAQGILVGIDAARTVEEVFADVQQVLQSAAAR